MKIRNKLYKKIIIAFLCSALSACSSMFAKQESAPIENKKQTAIEETATAVKTINLPIQSRVSLSDIDNSVTNKPMVLYSFVAKDLPIHDALQIFSKAYNLNIISDNDVDGFLTAEFNNLSFEQAMSAMLDSLGLYWEKEGELIKVRKWQTRTFTIDYLRLVRSGQGSSLANVNSTVSGSASAESGGSDNNDDGSFELKQEDSVEFWDELQEQLTVLMSEDGRLTINKMSGTIQVTDLHPRVKEVSQFINDINQAIHRQVEIDVKIVEVELNDDFSLGVDWNLVTTVASEGLRPNLGISNIITQPLGGFGALLPSASLSLFETDNNRLNFNTLITALKEQGDVNVVSQPKIRTLNNQSAMIKVGTDRTFFIRQVTTDSTSAGSTSFVEDVPSVVTEGIVMALTPQIAASGWIMLDISPIITRVTSVERVLDNNGNVTSSSPNLDIRQTSSLVRMQNGNTIAIGGLMQNTDSSTERAVPGLGEIPVIGNIFKGRYKVKRKKELLMFLTANLVDTSAIQLVAK